MTERRAVVWSEEAVDDLISIVDYAAHSSIERADRLMTLLRERTASLRAQSTRGRVVPELHRLGYDKWRELICAPYRIIYRVGEERVFVLALLDGRRDLQDLLLDRLIRRRRM